MLPPGILPGAAKVTLAIKILGIRVVAEVSC